MLKTIGTTFSAAFLCTTFAAVSAIASTTVKDFSGNADYYANCYHGKKTASGALHDKTKFMAAHRTLPFGTKVRITHRKTKKQCVVVINDRGPFTADRVIDVSYAAAQELGIVSGSKMVDCEVIAED